MTNSDHSSEDPSPEGPGAEGATDANQLTETARILRDVNAGEAGAADRLLPFLYDELHGLAARIMAGERDAHTLQPTALINEAFLRLVNREDPEWTGRRHFICVAARAMRYVLVDHARARNTKKRGQAAVQVTLDEGVMLDQSQPSNLLVVHETLERLGEVDPQLAQIVELRFFGGLGTGEIAATLAVSERSVQRGWRMARAWLSRELAAGEETKHDG